MRTFYCLSIVIFLYVLLISIHKQQSPFGVKLYARIFVLGHYLFLVAHSFRRASLAENCSFLATYNVRGQISEHIFAPNAD